MLVDDVLSGKKNSKIGFGSAAISGEEGGYGFGPMTDKDAQYLMELSLQAGIQVFDTAPIYGFGASEERIGSFLKGQREDVCVLAKGGVGWHGTKRVNMSNSPEHIDEMLHASLRRLGSTYIDIYMIHWPDSKVDIRSALEPVVKAKDADKVLKIGLCNTNFSDFNKASELCEISCLSGEWNAFQSNIEVDQLSSEQGLINFSWGTFDKGILTGNAYRNRKYDPTDARSWAPWWKKQPKDRKFSLVEKMLKFANNDKDRIRSFFLQLAQENAKRLPLVGYRSAEQLSDLLKTQSSPDLELLKHWTHLKEDFLNV
ncbi:MAG: aldo/keto reductase [Bdellovibrionales bacterium]